MRDGEGERLAERFEKAVGILIEQLDERRVCTVPGLGELLASDGELRRTVNKWVGQNGTRLADATGSTYLAGSHGQAGRFARQT